jgi:hypothetical protein
VARIHGRPGHLIVEAWSDDSGPDMGFERHSDATHAADAETLYEFFSGHVSFEETVRRLYYRLKDEFNWWDAERREWERDH